MFKVIYQEIYIQDNKEDNLYMENNNSVAFIEKIIKIENIEGADRIQLATTAGWTSIVQKDIHKVGDLVLCVITNACIPQELVDKWGLINYLRKGNRVRTIKLKGVYSECILIPLSKVSGVEAEVGQDLMKDQGIYKYEPSIQNIQITSGRKIKYHQNPNFHVYYKFPNQKNVPHMFNEDDDVVITRKIHGTNARYGIVKKTKLSWLDKIKKLFGNKWIEWEYVYGSHNIEKGSDSQGFYSTDIWKEIADKHNLSTKLWKYFKTYRGNKNLGTNIIFYGEIYGPGIQGDKYTYGLKEKDIKFFDLTLDGNYENHDYFTTICKKLNLNTVDVLYRGTWNKEKQDSFLNHKIEGTDVFHEGIVVKCSSGDRQKVSKVISQEYLICAEKFNIPDSH